ncbi:putative phosphatase [Ameyamaea chiangmaiensis NBRC 103196]|uniref:HAD-IA family hydrolase n=1 Tax=Ameyamaea chiangmaiensis TaxID=442969 RepID=UPI0021567A53|nr:HAD-IA family hydrolase [Ameyamaea chiangmaiensis]GBQ71050.1 putative phosphatase [Ameyamaea chiangmaiensis NBRC 103196]
MTERPLFPDTPVDAFLFDMDGTILTSILATERVWTRWARHHGIDVNTFLPTIHGIRAIETIRRQNLPGVDPEAEARWLTEQELADTDGIAPVPGALAFLHSLPPDRWAVVTSAPRDLALRRIAVAGLPLPDVLVTADDVTRGKPAPDCFELGARRLGVDPRRCVVFEDAPAGIAAGKAAGAQVVVITHTHQHPVDTPFTAVPGYEHLRTAARADGTMSLVEIA